MKGRKLLAMLCAIVMLAMNFSSCVPGLAEVISAETTQEPTALVEATQPTEAAESTEAAGAKAEVSEPAAESPDPAESVAESDEATESVSEETSDEPAAEAEPEAVETATEEKAAGEAAPEPTIAETEPEEPAPIEAQGEADAEEKTETADETPADPVDAPASEEPVEEQPTEEQPVAEEEPVSEEPIEEEPVEEEPAEEEPVEAVEPLTLTDLAASAQTVFPGETIQFTFNATGAERVDYRVYSEAGDVASGDAGAGFAWTPDAPGAYTVAIAARAGEETAAAELAVAVRPDYSGVIVTYTARYNGLDGFTVMPEYADVELAKGAYDLAAAGPVAPKGYAYVETLMGETKLDRLDYVEAERAWQYTVGGETALLTADARLVVAFDPAPTDRYYKYEDSQIIAEVTLANGSAVPDEARFVVTPITDGRNYDAYMQALNDNTAEEYTEINTLLYDFAFIVDELDPETGAPTGRSYEIKPERNNMTVKVTFRNNQITKVGAEDAGDVGVVHMPLNDGVLERRDVDTTAEAVNITAADVKFVEQLSDSKTDVDLEGRTDEVTFETKSFSVFAFTVDFTYEGKTYSLPGEGAYAVKDIMAALGIEGALAEDPALAFVSGDPADADRKLRLAKEDGEWVLVNEIPFTDTFKLTLSVGLTKYEIEVTDEGDSATALKVSISIYNYADTLALTAIPNNMLTADGDKAYLVVWVDSNNDGYIDGADANSPWMIREVSLTQGKDIPITESFDEFYTEDSTTGNKKTFAQLNEDTEKNKLRARLIHTTLPVGDLSRAKFKDNIQNENYKTIWNGGFDGYEMSTAHPTSTEPASDGSYAINLKQAYEKSFEIVLDVSGLDEADMHDIADGKTYVRFEALNKEGNASYYQTVEIKDVTQAAMQAAKGNGGDGKVRIPFENAWSSGQKYSNNWQNITAKVYTLKAPGQTIATGATDSIDTNNAAAETTMIGGYSFTNEMVPAEKFNTTIDAATNTQHMEYVFKLAAPTLDATETPETILGAASGFGIVANSYLQTGHTETNFAVNTFSSNVNLDIQGEGTFDVPIWVGKILDSSTAGLRLGGSTNVGVDVYCTEADSTKVNADNNSNTGFKLQTIIKTESEISAKVAELMNAGLSKSSVYSGKTTLTLTSRFVDLGDYPDNKTIYVNCGSITPEDLIIYKKPNQNIVFNVPGTGDVKIGRFSVSVYQPDGALPGAIESTTTALNPSGYGHAHNVDVDNEILEHIVFNAYEASTVNITDASAIFLAPAAATVNQTNGAGWIMTRGTVISDKEWHFYHFRSHNYDQVKFTGLNFKKVVTGGTDSTNPEFNFTLYLWKEAEVDGETVKQALEANECTEIAIKVDGNEYEGTGFVSDPEDACTYDEHPTIVLQSVPLKKNETLTVEGIPDGTKYAFVENENLPDRYESTSGTLTGTTTAIATTREYVNHYTTTDATGSLKVTKQVFYGNVVAGDDATKAKNFTFTVKNSANEYLKADGSTFITDKAQAGKFTVSMNTPKVFSALPVDTYTVTELEEGRDISGYRFRTSSSITTGNKAVAQGANAEVQLKNYYDQLGSVKVTKTFNGNITVPADFKITATYREAGATADTALVLKVNPTENTGEIGPDAAEPASDGSSEKPYTWTISNLLLGTSVTFTEANYNVTGYDVDATGTATASAKASLTETGAVANMTNTYTQTSSATGSLTLSGSKKVNGEAPSTAENGKFSFVLAAEDSAPTKKADGTAYAETELTVTNNGGTITLPTLYYTQDDVDNTYTYTVRETGEDIDGYTLDKSVYTVTVEIANSSTSGTLSVNETIKQTVDKSGANISAADQAAQSGVTIAFDNDYTQPTTPTFEKKVKDINDSEGTAFTGWQDAADHDIGDDVPFLLRATLASNVTDYKTYHIRFFDTMDQGLTFTKIKSVKVGTTEIEEKSASNPTGYVFEQDGQSFTLTLEWTGESGARISDENLNGATVEVEYEAKLNDKAVYGATGNVNTAYLRYSKNSSLTDGGDFTKDDETGKTDEDSVIVFTYQVEVNKVDENGNALPGATFTLQKKLANGGTKTIAVAEAAPGTKFTFKGLDDGDYVLTETVAPNKYVKLDPIEFTLSAGHKTGWDGTAEKKADTYKAPEFGGDLTFTKVDGKDLYTTKVANQKYTASGELVLSGTKRIEGRDLTANDIFTFEFSVNGGTPIELHNDATGRINYPKQTYTQDDANKTFTYTVRETSPNTATITADTTNYTVKVKIEDDGEGNLTAVRLPGSDDPAALNFVNKLNTGNLTVRKEVAPAGAARGTDFTFTVTLTEKLNGTYGDMTFRDGVATFTLKHNQTRTATGLPATIGYKVAETPAEGYVQQSSSNAESIIDKDATKTATFVNRYIYKVKVSKVDVTDQHELEDAHIQIIDSQGNVVEQWDSTKEPHETGELKAGEVYTLRETVAPEGYTITSDTRFSINEDGTVNRITGNITSDGVILVEDARKPETTTTAPTTTAPATTAPTTTAPATTAPATTAPATTAPATTAPATTAPATTAPATTAPATTAPATTAPATTAPATTAPATTAPATTAPATTAPATTAPATTAPATTAPATTAPATVTATATPAPAPTAIAGRKIWVDEDNAYKARPESITVELYANGEKVDKEPTWRKAKGNEWFYSFGSMPSVTETGATITYTVRELPVEFYETSIEGTTIINKLAPKGEQAYAELSGTKTWDDNDNVSGQRPTSITVHLLQDGVVIETLTVTAEDGWAYSFGEQPVDNGYGATYAYEVREENVPGYFSRSNGLNLTNILLFDEKPNGDFGIDQSGGSLQVKSRNTKTRKPTFNRYSEEEFEDLLDILDYGTPLFGMLGTCDETPVYPFAFGGVGIMALVGLIITRRRRRAYGA